MYSRLALVSTFVLLVSASAAAATIRKAPSVAYPTIQSAIAASAAGDTVEIKAGTYAQPLLLDSIVPMTVRGKGKVVFDAQAQIAGIRITDSANVTIENIEVRGAPGAGVHVVDSPRVALKKVRSIGSQSDGFLTEGGFALWLSQCVARDSGHNGFMLETSQSCVRRCSAFDSGNVGIELDGDANVIQQCTIDGTDTEGIWVHHGLSNGDVDAVSIEDNKVRDVGTIGVFVSGGDGSALLRGNKVKNSLGVGIEVTLNGVACVGNSVANTQLSGFWIASQRSMFQGNSVKNAGADGFLAQLATDMTTFSGNSVKGAEGVGFVLDGSPITFVKNKAKQCTGGEAAVGPGAIILAFENGFDVN